MNTLVRAAVALAAALLGFGGFVAVQAATGPDDQQAAKREDSLAALTTADDSPSPDDTPSPDVTPDDTRTPEATAAVANVAPAAQDDSPDGVDDDGSTRTRTGHDGSGTVNTVNTVNTADSVGSVDTADTGTSGADGSDTSGSDSHGDDDRSGSSSGRG